MFRSSVIGRRGHPRRDKPGIHWYSNIAKCLTFWNFGILKRHSYKPMWKKFFLWWEPSPATRPFKRFTAPHINTTSIALSVWLKKVFKDYVDCVGLESFQKIMLNLRRFIWLVSRCLRLSYKTQNMQVILVSYTVCFNIIFWSFVRASFFQLFWVLLVVWLKVEIQKTKK